MTVTLSYDATLSRVRIGANGLGAAIAATVERSANQITWTTVRGGARVPVTGGEIPTVDDYEFSPSVVNYYRVRYFAVPSFVAAGTADTDNNAAVTPGLPAGRAAGDVLLLFAAIRNYGLGTVNTPAGWTELLSMNGNAKVFGKVSAGGADVGPTVTFANGTAGSDTAAQICALRNVDMNSFAGTSDADAGQNIVTPVFDLGETWHGAEVLYLGWKADDWTSVALAQGTEIAEIVMTTGNDMGMVWNHRSIAETVEFDELGAQTFTVTGGGVAQAQGGVAAMTPSSVSQSSSITPAMSEIWLKNLSRPFLNLPVTVTDWSDIEIGARAAAFPIKGRSLPIAVSDLMLGRSFTLTLRAATVADAEDIRLSLASGDPILLHTPPGCMVPGPMYATVGNPRIRRGGNQRAPQRFIDLPLEEVAAPTADVVGTTNTWAAVIATYATWADLIAANATWQNLLDGVADTSDVIVS